MYYVLSRRECAGYLLDVRFVGLSCRPAASVTAAAAAAAEQTSRTAVNRRILLAATGSLIVRRTRQFQLGNVTQ